MEEVEKWQNGDERGTPSKACSRNKDLRVQMVELKKKFNGKLKLFHVKAHQDDVEEYKYLSFEGRRNADCDAAVRRGRDTVSRCTAEERAMLWSNQGGHTEDPYA